MRLGRAPLRAAAIAGLLLAGAPPARAQGSVTAGVHATANILYPALTGVGTRPLDFGVIVPGTTNVVIAPRTPSGGEFRISGLRWRRSSDISLVLPASLAGPAGASIPLSFNGNYAAVCEIDATNVCQAWSVVAWNPVTTPLYHHVSPLTVYLYDQLDLYLGGVAAPSPTQPAGRYTGSITVLITVN
jgi:hypothetical protein